MLSKKKSIGAFAAAGALLCTLNYYGTIPAHAAANPTAGFSVLVTGKKDDSWKTSLLKKDLVKTNLEKSTQISRWILDPDAAIKASSQTASAAVTADNAAATAETAEAEVPEEKMISPELENKVITTVSDYQNIRESASEDAAVIGRLYAGGAGTILGVDGDWIYIQSGDVSGWVHKDYVVYGEQAQEYAESNISEIATVSEDGVRIREEASADAAKLVTADAGDTFMVCPEAETVVDEQGLSWTKVSYEDQEAYVCSDYVSVEFDLGQAKSMEQIEAEEKAAEEAAAAEKAAEEAAAQKAAEEAAAQKAAEEAAAAEKAAAEQAAAAKAAADKAAADKAAAEQAAAAKSAAQTTTSDDTGWVSLGQFKITAYCGGACCNGKWAGTTASGATPAEGRTIAVAPWIIPYGTQVKIEGMSGIYVAEDTGGFAYRNDHQIDLFVANHSAANSWGVVYRQVWIKK